MSRPVTFRYPTEPVADICRARWREPNPSDAKANRRALHGDAAKIAAATGVDRMTAHRWIVAGGLSELQADRCAIALGLHPGEIWPEWWEAA